MKIGSVSLPSPFVVAPMAGMTDSAFRRLVKRQGGCGLVVTEMVSSEGLVRSIDRTLENIRERAQQIATAGALPAFVGGDHSISLGVLRGLAAVHGPLGLVHFDAHSDTYGPAWDVDVHHGTIFRNSAEEGLLRKGDAIQIGIRGPLTAANDRSARMMRKTRNTRPHRSKPMAGMLESRSIQPSFQKSFFEGASERCTKKARRKTAQTKSSTRASTRSVSGGSGSSSSVVSAPSE